MDKIHEIAGDGALMPRFDDGMVNIAELIKGGGRVARQRDHGRAG